MKIIHMMNPFMDTSLCGVSDDGVLIDGGQPNYGGVVTCQQCMQIISACVEYTAQLRVNSDTANAPEKSAVSNSQESKTIIKE